MKPCGDAFGHMIADFHSGNRAGQEIVERDDGYFDATGGPRAYFREYHDWPPHEKNAMKYVRGAVLDIGCGAARHSLHLQREGFDVTGIDVSPRALKVARERGLKRTRLISITQVGAALGAFDTVLMLGNNFGLFGSLTRARWLLRRFKRLTTGDARIIAESNNIYETTNPWHLRYQKQNRRRGRMSGQVRIRVRYHTHVTPWFDYLLVSQEEMKKVLKGTGWHVARFVESGSAPYIGVIEKD
jgi:SAM-dependent methyltransferase